MKRALTWAHFDSEYKQIKESTTGVVFFGTPHRGSSKATYGSILANLAARVMHQPKSKPVNALKTNSDELAELTSEFKNLAPNYRILSFYELKRMGIFTSLVSLTWSR